ncbi:MAG: hypothetical protein RIT28_2863, partial [Pseudomonadota bacterium]
AYAERVLFSADLADKLRRPEAFTDTVPGPAIGAVSLPARPAGLALDSLRGKAEFPRDLAPAAARGRALHFFANHELLAMELMALGLLRFPEAPPEFRLGLANALRDEQRHLALYLGRMEALGVGLGELPVSRFFWDALCTMDSPAALAAGLGLVLEQANLDFCVHYAAAFRAVGDEESGALMDLILRDELRHVRHGLRWVRHWQEPGEDLFSAWERLLKPPLSPARARGLSFDAAPRRAVGLPEDFIQRLASFGRSKGRPPVVRAFVASGEEEWRGEAPSAVSRALERDLGLLPVILSGEDDLVVLPRAPSPAFLARWRDLGLPVPELLESPALTDAAPRLATRHVAAVEPWAWTPTLRAAGFTPGGHGAEALASKALAATLLRRVLEAETEPRLDPPSLAGHVVHTAEDAVEAAMALLAAGAPEVILKAALSTAGRDRLRLRAPPDARGLHTIERLTAWGPVVVEPWLRRVLDLSLLTDVSADGALTVRGLHRFFTSPGGRYLGSWVGRPTVGLSPELARFFTGDGQSPAWIERALTRAARIAAAEAHRLGYVGPIGLDALIHETPDGLRLRPLVELNPRLSMGRVALALGRRLGPGAVGVWRVLSAQDLKRAGHRTIAAWAASRPAPDLDPRGLWRGGVVLTNEPHNDTQFISAVGVGMNEAACLHALGVPW